jgi:hypothetical protein
MKSDDITFNDILLIIIGSILLAVIIFTSVRLGELNNNIQECEKNYSGCEITYCKIQYANSVFSKTTLQQDYIICLQRNNK